MGCPNCGAPGGGPSGCGSCGLGRNPNVGGHINAGQTEMKIAQDRKKHSNSSTGGCFPAGTKISTPSGVKAIEDVSVGEFITSVNPKTGRALNCKVLRCLSYDNRKISRVQFSDGTYLKATNSHSFRMADQWKSLRQLKVGDDILCHSESDGKHNKTIVSISSTSQSEAVYNLITEDQHNFIADGAIAHNFTHFRTLRMLAWSIRVGLRKLASEKPISERIVSNTR